MNKKIISIIVIVLIIIIAFLLRETPDERLQKEIETINQEAGEASLEEEFLGPNTNMTSPPPSTSEEFINF